MEESLKKEIMNNEEKLEILILLIYATYLYAEQKYDLGFVCEVAALYVDEIFDENLNYEDLENLCSETLLNN